MAKAKKTAAKKTKKQPVPVPWDRVPFGKTPFYIVMGDDPSGDTMVTWVVRIRSEAVPDWAWEILNNTLHCSEFGGPTSLAKAQAASLKAADKLFTRYKKFIDKLGAKKMKAITNDLAKLKVM